MDQRRIKRLLEWVKGLFKKREEPIKSAPQFHITRDDVIERIMEVRSVLKDLRAEKEDHSVEIKGVMEEEEWLLRILAVYNMQHREKKEVPEEEGLTDAST